MNSNISSIYAFNAILFLLTGGFSYVQYRINGKRRTLEPFIFCVFIFLSASYSLHALTYLTASSVLFLVSVICDLTIAILCFFYIALALGKEGIPPFHRMFKYYVKFKKALGEKKFPFKKEK